jgi:hypothetical protein
MPKAADTSSTPEADAGLIALCAEIVALQAKIKALHKVRHTAEGRPLPFETYSLQIKPHRIKPRQRMMV